MTANTALKDIPLNQLTAWEGNARKTHTKAGIDELAASIKAHGLLQSLVVFKDGKKFSVVAGNRRLAALTMLQKAGDIGADFQVPCKVAEDENAAELSLAENSVRENMHPTDECEAYCELVDKGTPAADIAARFGKTEQYVLQRLKLAKVSPQVIKAYRDGKLTLEHVQAFAVSDDHKAQNKVLKEFRPEYDEASDIRHSLTESEVSADDKRVKYVTIKAYEKAGGQVKRDLFSTDDDSVTIGDIELLDRMVDEKLARSKAALEKEGWKWVEIVPDFDYRAKAKFTALEETLSPLPAKAEAKRKKLQEEYDALDKAFMEDDDAERPDRLDEISEEIEAINEERVSSWTEEQLAIAGAALTLGYNGKVEISRGLVRPEDKPKAKAKGVPAPGGNAAEEQEDASPEFSAGLIEDLTAEKSVALSACLIDEPAIALAAVVYTMTMDAFEHIEGFNPSCLSTGTSDKIPMRMEETKAGQKIETVRKEWAKKLPKTAPKLWDWCMKQKTDVLLELMAFCAAISVDSIQRRTDKADSDRLANADQLAAAVKLDMKDWFMPTAENYFNRVSKQQIIDAMKEIGKGGLLDNAKTSKSDAASVAGTKAEGSGWLPSILRKKG